MPSSQDSCWQNKFINKIMVDYYLHCTAYDANTTAELMGHDNLERRGNNFI